MDLRLGFYVFGISRARRMGIDRVLIHTKFFDILAPLIMMQKKQLIETQMLVKTQQLTEPKDQAEHLETMETEKS